MDLLSILARELASQVSAQLGVSAWVDQQTSPLGRNRHCRAAKRRLDEAKPGEDVGVRKIGRRYLMSPDAIREESLRLLMSGRPGPAKTKPDEAFARAIARAREARRG